MKNKFKENIGKLDIDSIRKEFNLDSVKQIEVEMDGKAIKGDIIQEKDQYRGWSHGRFYYVYAYSVNQAYNLIRAQALKAVGKYNITEIWKHKGKWVKIPFVKPE